MVRLTTNCQLLIGLVLTATLLGVSAIAQMSNGETGQMNNDPSMQERIQPRCLKYNLPVESLFPRARQVVTPALDLTRLLHEDSAAGGCQPLRIGVVQHFPEVRIEDGVKTDLPDGGQIWTLSFKAAGARAVNIRITPWKPVPGAELFVIDLHNKKIFYGPFTRSDPLPMTEFWTPAIHSEEVGIEYYLPPGLVESDLKSRLAISDLANVYRGIFDEITVRVLLCHPDIACYEDDWGQEAKGVVGIKVFGREIVEKVSGALIRRRPEDNTPLVITARHSGLTNDNIGSAEFLWFFQYVNCLNPPYDASDLSSMTVRTNGRAVLKSHSGSDFMLVGLNPDIPDEAAFLDWDETPWTDAGSQAVGIHHPGSLFDEDPAPKKIAFGTYETDAEGCSVAGGCVYCYTVDFPQGSGLIEGGSSGSPIFDGAGRVRGVASCAPDVLSCDEDSYARYGKLSAAYESLSPYLVPAVTVFVKGTHSGEELGTMEFPFNTVVEGVFAVKGGGDLYIEIGSYDETLVITKAMTIRPRNGEVTIGKSEL